MSDAETTTDRIEAVRHGTIDILESLLEGARTFELPEPPPLLEEYRSKLEENTYRVLVVGEAKRGKSTFVNALIGRTILPTDVDVATSQVFHIRQAEYEAYHLRFEDGSEQEIAAEELARYGSQMVIDIQGTPRLDQLIRWIEVDIPTHFLPKGVSLLDTPGVGTLYAAHAQITQRFVPFADAVIFVLDSGQPIIQAELDFLDKILDVTSNIFFIQTKVDRYRREQWQAIQRRNEEILNEQFKDRLLDRRIWPISSTNLLKANQTGDQDYLVASRYNQLSTVLQTFLFRVAGWDRSAAAMKVAESYYTTGRRTLMGRVASLTEESEQKRSAMPEGIRQRKEQFEVAWGQDGQQQRDLMQQIDRVIQAKRQAFLTQITVGNRLEVTTRQKINGMKTVQEAEQYNQVMDEEVIGWFFERWRETVQQTQNQCKALLIPFLTVANEISFPEEASGFREQLTSASHKLQIKTSLLDAFVAADTPSAASFDWLSLIQNFARKSFRHPILGEGAAVLLDVCWHAIRGWRHLKRAQVEEAKEQLTDRLNNLLQTVQGYFLNTDLLLSHENYVDHYFGSLKDAMTAHVQKIVERKSAEAQAELNRLAEQAQLDEQQRKAQAQQVQEQLSQWETIHQAIEERVRDLEMLEQSLATSSTSA